jgi:hypothetical protein
MNQPIDAASCSAKTGHGMWAWMKKKDGVTEVVTPPFQLG